MPDEMRETAISPCTVGDFIHRQNVVSKQYLVPKDEMEAAMQDFMSVIIAADLKPTALPFFIMSPLEDDSVKIRYYLPIEQVNPTLPEGMHFDSYFAIDNMVSLCISKNLQENMSEAYIQLYQYLEDHAYQPITPIFQVMGGDKNNQYAFLKVGYKML